MLLRNYDNIMAARRAITLSNATVSTDTTTFGDGHINVKDTNGSLRALYISSSWRYDPLSYFFASDMSTSASADGMSKLVVGSGNTFVTYDDYKLTSQFTTSQVVHVTGTHKVTTVYDEETNNWVHTYSRTFVANEDITVREVGAITGGYTSSNSSFMALVYRKVLEEEIVVPANASFVVTFVIKVVANPNGNTVSYDTEVTV